MFRRGDRCDGTWLGSLAEVIAWAQRTSIDLLVEIKDPDTPYRRLALKVPLLPQMFSDISRWRFYEDAVMDERLTQEL